MSEERINFQTSVSLKKLMNIVVPRIIPID